MLLPSDAKPELKQLLLEKESSSLPTPDIRVSHCIYRLLL